MTELEIWENRRWDPAEIIDFFEIQPIIFSLQERIRVAVSKLSPEQQRHRRLGTILAHAHEALEKDQRTW